MAATYLDAIVAAHRRRASVDSRDWRSRSVQANGPSLRDAILAHRPMGNSVIAEVKRRSPSKGELWAGDSIEPLRDAYVAGGATGVSVLTDSEFFGGSVGDLRTVRTGSLLPVLRKDFTVSINDVLDTAEMGASCVLLIAAALTSEELPALWRVARDIGLDALVEVHDENEAQRAVEIGASMIGVNQRDLHTFLVDTERANRVVASLPPDVVRVAESGFHTAASVELAASAGFDAVLVGEAFVTSTEPATMVRSFLGHPIGRRGDA